MRIEMMSLLRRVLLGTLFPLLVAAAAAQETASPGSPHGALSLDCSSCHTAEAWVPARQPMEFDHGDDTGFPLVASHGRVACMSCHESLRFHMVATACADCHEDPHRGEVGVSCEDCHSTRGWNDRGRFFDLHARTMFPLTGVHASVDCAACHGGAPPFELQAVSTQCIGCHAADFEATRDPDHLEAGFPESCESCHGTSSWEARNFPQHDGLFFPIFSGAHRGEWVGCSDCHVQPREFQRFECIDCHAHQRAEMRDEHDDVDDYVYQSVACLECHPDGRE